jgi:hypothetical protein
VLSKRFILKVVMFSQRKIIAQMPATHAVSLLVRPTVSLTLSVDESGALFTKCTTI